MPPPFWWFAGAAFVVCAAGLFLGKRWGALLWYAIALTVSCAWLVSVVRVALDGWPYPGVLESLISLVPGLLLLLVCVGGSVAVARDFRRARHAL